MISELIHAIFTYVIYPLFRYSTPPKGFERLKLPSLSTSHSTLAPTPPPATTLDPTSSPRSPIHKCFSLPRIQNIIWQFLGFEEAIYVFQVDPTLLDHVNIHTLVVGDKCAHPIPRPFLRMVTSIHILPYAFDSVYIAVHWIKKYIMAILQFGRNIDILDIRFITFIQPHLREPFQTFVHPDMGTQQRERNAFTSLQNVINHFSGRINHIKVNIFDLICFSKFTSVPRFFIDTISPHTTNMVAPIGYTTCTNVLQTAPSSEHIRLIIPTIPPLHATRVDIRSEYFDDHNIYDIIDSAHVFTNLQELHVYTATWAFYFSASISQFHIHTNAQLFIHELEEDEPVARLPLLQF